MLNGKKGGKALTYSFLLYNVLVLDSSYMLGLWKRACEKILGLLEKHFLAPFNFFALALRISYPMFSSNVWLYISHLFRRSSVVSTASAAAERLKVSS